MAAGLKQKTEKVLDIIVDGYRLTCIVHYDQTNNPYHLYLNWWNGERRQTKQLAKYGNFFSVIDNIHRWMLSANVGFRDGPF